MLELQLLKNNNLLEINIDFLARSFLIQPMTSIIIVLKYFVLCLSNIVHIQYVIIVT